MKKKQEGEVQIIIPSFRRSHLIATHTIVDSVIVCIPESDYKDYVSVGVPKESIVCHPDNVIGLCPKRNWIFDNLQNGKPMLSLDDDINCMISMSANVGEKVKRLNPLEIRTVVENTAQMCEDIGAKFFGFASSPDPRIYSDHKPIGLTGFVNGWSMGFLPDHKFRFPDNLVGKEDYFVSLLNAYHHRICFINNLYGFSAKGTFTNTGGLAVYRNSETEKQAIAYLKKCFGSVVVSVEKAGFGANARAHTGYQKMGIALPF